MLKRVRTSAASFVEPCLPSSIAKPPSGAGWIHEIKHDGNRLMARRDSAGVRLITRNGYDWSERSPAIAQAVNMLAVRSCLIDGEVIACDDFGLAVFQKLRRRRDDCNALLCAFDLLELNGRDLRREPIEARKQTLAGLLKGARFGIALNEHFNEPGELVYRPLSQLS